MENSKDNGRIPELDGIRGVAIAMVLAFHYFYVPSAIAPGGLAANVLGPLRIGWTGVDLFFVLSGFLIGGILLDVRESSSYFKTFYARRFYRIVPVYAVVLCACFVLTVMLDHGHAVQFSWMLGGRLPWLPYVFFVQNLWMAEGNTLGMPGLNVTWSLAVEEQFYLTLPLIVWLFGPRLLRRVVVGVVIGAPIIRTILYFVWPQKFLMPFLLMPCRADALLLGVLAAIVMRTPTSRLWVENHHRVIVGAMFVLLAGCAFVSPFPTSPLMESLGYTWVALLYTMGLVYVLTRKASVLGRILRTGWLMSLGKIAYGVYLLHGIVLVLVSGGISPEHPIRYSWPALDSFFQLGVTIVALFLTLGLSHLSWLYFEKPLVQIGHSWKY